MKNRLISYIKAVTIRNINRRKQNNTFDYLIISLITIILILGLKAFVERFVGQERPFLFIGAIIISAWIGGLRAGLFATLFSTIIIGYQMFVPYPTPTSHLITHLAELSLYIFESLTVSFLIETMYSAMVEQKRVEELKDEFMSIASHELKTPLTSIKAYTQLLARYADSRQDNQAIIYLRKISSQIDRLAKLIIDLLDISKIQEGKLVLNNELFSFGALVREMVEEIQTTTRDHQIRIIGRCDKNMIADRFRIGQVITNLLINAIKYSHNSRKIIVRLSAGRKTINMSVRDFGIGIPANEQEKIFQRFYRVDFKQSDSYPGLGLGLYISAEIVKRHHGTISVKSKIGRGSTFIISLPQNRRG